MPPGCGGSTPTFPGWGGRPPGSLRSADDVLGTLLAFAEAVTGGTAYLLVGHSAGGCYAHAMAARRPAQVAGLALVCPLLPGVRDVPEHRVVAGSGALGDDDFRGYFVVQTPEMLDRYERHVAPAAALVDSAALARIGERWELTPDGAPPYPGPALVVAGRLDSTVGYAGAVDLLDQLRTPPWPWWTTRGTPSPRATGAAARPARGVARPRPAPRSVAAPTWRGWCGVHTLRHPGRTGRAATQPAAGVPASPHPVVATTGDRSPGRCGPRTRRTRCRHWRWP